MSHAQLKIPPDPIGVKPGETEDETIPTELLEDIVRRLVEGLGSERILLFGSHAYGQPNEMSDIDLLIVVSESNEPRHHRARKACRYLRGATAPTELIVLTQQGIAQAVKVPTSLVNRAVYQWRTLYGRTERRYQ